MAGSMYSDISGIDSMICPSQSKTLTGDAMLTSEDQRAWCSRLSLAVVHRPRNSSRDRPVAAFPSDHAKRYAVEFSQHLRLQQSAGPARHQHPALLQDQRLL